MSRLAPTEEARRAVENAVPLRRMGTRDEIADVAIFLCSSAAAYVTGSVYHCDGGSGLIGPRMLQV
jgi:NAD(P)-dependent dehydrogenase (short-subunit alcohol dehydrogenase family)